MFDDVAALFHENVIVAYQEYIRARTSRVAGRSQDLRLALSAAAALYHFREHLPKNLRRSRVELEKACADYGLLGDIVNASKHGELTHGRLVSGMQPMSKSWSFSPNMQTSRERTAIQRKLFL